MNIIGHIQNDFKEKFGLPRQSALGEDIISKIVFENEYRVAEAFRGIESYSHLWIIWQFSENKDVKWSPTVRPPVLGGKTRMGVFATRSPIRPNPIGLSCVRLVKYALEEHDGPVLYIAGTDMMNGTPIYDIKPYVPFSDSRPDAIGGFADQHKDEKLKVCIPDEIKAKLPADKLKGLVAALSCDPRPAYHDDDERLYAISYADKQVKFYVSDDEIKVTDIL